MSDRYNISDTLKSDFEQIYKKHHLEFKNMNYQGFMDAITYLYHIIHGLDGLDHINEELRKEYEIEHNKLIMELNK